MVDNGEDVNSHHDGSTLAIFDIPDRSLEEVEWTTSVLAVKDLPRGKRVLVNPNTVVLIDEREHDN